MKKLMVLAAVAAMGAMGAKAAYNINSSYFEPAKGDKSPALVNLQSYYQAYIIQCAGGGEAALAYVQQQGLEGIQQAALSQFNCKYSWNNYTAGQYLLKDAAANPKSVDVSPEEAYLVVYYGQGDAVSEFAVVGNATKSGVWFDDEMSKYKSGWQTYTAPQPQPGPVPEPTSGLLLLLGMAGLALKRKLNG